MCGFVIVTMLIAVLLGADIVFWLGFCAILLYALATFAPRFGVLVRRLQDTGRSGWWFLINFVPYVGVLILLILLAMPGEPSRNQYGDSP